MNAHFSVHASIFELRINLPSGFRSGVVVHMRYCMFGSLAGSYSCGAHVLNIEVQSGMRLSCLDGHQSVFRAICVDDI